MNNWASKHSNKPKIAILTEQMDNASCENLQEAFESRGYEVDYVQYASFKYNQPGKDAIIRDIHGELYISNAFKYDGESFSPVENARKAGQYSGVVLRAWTAPDEGFKALDMFEEAGVMPLNHIKDIRNAGSKLATSEIFKSADIPHPDAIAINISTGLTEEHNRFLERHEPPYVIKGNLGTQGKAIYFCDSVDEIISVVSELGQDAVMQEYIKTGDKQQTYRLFVVNDEVVGTMRLTAEKEGVAVTNTGSGGDPELCELPQELNNIAVKAAKAMNLTVSGVDMIIGEDSRPYVLEANDSPKVSTLVEKFGVPAHEKVAESFVRRIEQAQSQDKQSVVIA